MNAQTKIGDAVPARAASLRPQPPMASSQSGIAIAPRAMLGQCIHALNLAARQIDALGGDGSQFRDTAAEAQTVRWPS